MSQWWHIFKPLRQAAIGFVRCLAKQAALAHGVGSFVISVRLGNLQSKSKVDFVFLLEDEIRD